MVTHKLGICIWKIVTFEHNMNFCFNILDLTVINAEMYDCVYWSIRCNKLTGILRDFKLGGAGFSYM